MVGLGYLYRKNKTLYGFFMNNQESIRLPGIGEVTQDSGFIKLEQCSDGFYREGKEGVVCIYATGDKKVEFISFEDRTIAYVKSAMGYPAYYPVPEVKIEKPLKAVLMDLDGTTVRSEEFWIWIIQQTTASLLGNPKFELEDADLPYVSGHSVSEHLKYCVNKYCPDKTVEEARGYYFEHTHREMQAILEGHGREGAFTPSPGIKDFLLELKGMGVKLGLVTSGLYEKAYPEILDAFHTLGMGKPEDFYDSFITAGFPLRKGSCGTLGELSPKPHPWLYAEVARVGLGLDFSHRHSIVGIEDSSAGISSIRLAGFAAIGIKDGNIIQGGTLGLCNHYCDTFEEILAVLK
jgi:beta-phosphoglucomutase